MLNKVERNPMKSLPFFLIPIWLLGCNLPHFRTELKTDHIHYRISTKIKQDSIFVLKIKKENISQSPTFVYGAKWGKRRRQFTHIFKECAKNFRGDTVDWPEIYYSKFAPADYYVASNNRPIPVTKLKGGQKLREKYQLPRPLAAPDFVLVQREFAPSVFLRYYLSSLVKSDDSLWESQSRAYYIPIHYPSGETTPK